MTTPYDIITRAMKDIGALASGENPTTLLVCNRD
jgi:hypothetical protein